MNQGAEFESAKIEIRSILITYQKGCSLTEFRKAYRNLIGQNLPAAKFGFRDDVDYLYAIPDVVKLYSSGRDYHLMGVADESTQHIQNMVCKQKPSKHKPMTRPPRHIRYPTPQVKQPLLTNPRRIYERFQVPPRFTTVKKQLPPKLMSDVVTLVRNFFTGLSIGDFFTRFSEYFNRKFSFRDHGFSTLEECIETIPDLALKTKNNQILIYYTGVTDSQSESKSTLAPAAFEDHSSNQESWENTPRRESNRITRNKSREEIQIANCLSKWESEADKPTDCFESYNFHRIPPPNPVVGKFQCSPDDGMYKRKPITESSAVKDSRADILDSFNLVHGNTSYVPVSEKIRNNLRKVAIEMPQGILAHEFPLLYEKVIKSTFNLHSLGFVDLATFVDTVPDILKRRDVPGSQNDWFVYPVDFCDEGENATVASDSKSGDLLIQSIILTVRHILQAYPEGIRLIDFLHIYSINCLEPLHITDLGFGNIENFLLSIAASVPLRIGAVAGYKSVHLAEIKDEIQPPKPMRSAIATYEEGIKMPIAAYEDSMSASIPCDAASPDCQYKPMKIPSDLDTSKYVPVYTSAISHPGSLYIQLQGPDTSEAQLKMYEHMEDFYRGHLSNLYQMKTVHIKLNAMCAALWPEDGLWYRAKIVSVESADSVRVFYVDYGTNEVVPNTMLRYLKEVYSKLPAQAMRARLAHLKPPNNATKWNRDAYGRLLEMCQDVSLMAKIEDVTDSVLSLVLCNTNGERDVYINDVLEQEGLADVLRKGQSQVPASEQLQVQYLAAFTAFTKAMTNNNVTPDKITQMVHNLSMNSLNSPLLAASNEQQVVIPPPNPAAASMFPVPSVGGIFQPNPFLVSPPSAADFQTGQPSVFSSHSPVSQLPIKMESFTPGLASRSPPNESSEMFQDDDDFFEEFLLKVANVSKRYVKRIRTTDGYVFNILIVESQPYISSGDMSLLIWCSEEPNYLLGRLQNREIVLPSRNLLEESNEEMFAQFKRFHVKGSQTVNEKSRIQVYPLDQAIEILNLFGHPSAELRTTISNEISSFNPQHPMWQEVSEVEVPEDEEEDFKSTTDDDKLNKLSLYDLLPMKNGISNRRFKLMKSLENDRNNSRCVDELDKLEHLLQKVVERIEQVKHICQMFS